MKRFAKVQVLLLVTVVIAAVLAVVFCAPSASAAENANFEVRKYRSETAFYENSTAWVTNTYTVYLGGGLASFTLPISVAGTVDANGTKANSRTTVSNLAVSVRDSKGQNYVPEQYGVREENGGRFAALEFIPIVQENNENASHGENLPLAADDAEVEEPKGGAGEYEVTLRYLCSLPLDENKGADIVFATLFPRGMTLSKNATATYSVTFDGDEIEKAEGVTEDFETEKTQVITLPDNYFTKAYSTLFIVVMALSIFIFSVATIVIWYYFGRDKILYDTDFKFVPEDITPIDAGLLFDGRVKKSDFKNLILNWAERGYVAVYKTHEDAEIIKLKSLPDDALRYEHTLFDGLFAYAEQRFEILENASQEFMDIITDDKTNKRFSVKISEIPKDKLKKLLASVKRQAKRQLKSGARAVYTRKSKNMQKLSYVIMLLIPVAICVCGNILTSRIPFWVSPIVAAVLFLCSLIFNEAWVTRRSILGKSLMITGSFLTVAVYTGLWLIFGGSFMLIFFIASGVAHTVGMFFASATKKRTEFAFDKISKLIGLRVFIGNADTDELLKLSLENDNYFHKVFPYASAMGAEREWRSKFPNALGLPNVLEIKNESNG